MNRKLLCASLLAASLTAGCVSLGPAKESVVKGGPSITATIQNPVDSVDVYRTKNVFAATRVAVVRYREFCWGKPYREIMLDSVARPICENRRARVRAMQSADLKAERAIAMLDDFSRKNPNISAVSLAGAAWNAVSSFQATVTQQGAVP